MTSFNYTKRVENIITLAGKIASSPILTPWRLLAGVCAIGESISQETAVLLQRDFGADVISEINSHERYCKEKPDRENQISPEAKQVFIHADQLREKYNQGRINEGHLIRALLESNDISNVISTEIKQKITQVACVPRDLSVHLDSFRLPEKNDHVLRVEKSDENQLLHFVESEFGERWLVHIRRAFHDQSFSQIYLYVSEGEIKGFACYDLVRKKKGLLGPMGVSRNHYEKGIGKCLLDQCLYDMKEIGYEYAIIGEAGPVEFYERNVQAKLIPIQ